MGWEARGSRRYYTRSKRVSGRIIREYVGAAGAPVAELAAAADALRRADRKAASEARRAEEARWQAALGPLLELSRAVDVVVRATLLAGGFHRHARTWRKKRYVHNNDNAPEAGRRGP